MTGQQLKNSILQMAIQGKLVPQDPNDEPASVLLERIRKEREQLVKEGKIKKEKNPSYIFRGPDNLPYEKVGNNKPVCIVDELPFEIPDSWEWVHLSDIAISGLGKTLNKSIDDGTDTPYLCSINVYWTGIDLTTVKTAKFTQTDRDRYLLQKGDLLICEGGDVGRSAVWNYDKEMYYQNALHRVRFLGKVNPYFFLYLLECYKGLKIIEEYSKGVTIKHFVQSSLNAMFLPLPPLNEQQRIVNKINEAMPVVAKYDTTHSKVKELNETFPEVLKRSILQWAVQGRLVPQNPTDEPASVLLERIREEKQRLIKEGKIKKDKHESIIFRRDNSYYEKLDGVERCIDDELPFDIPDSWEWSRLSLVSNMYTGNSINEREKKLKYMGQTEGLPYIGTKDVGIDYTIHYDNGVRIPFDANKFRVAPAESVLLCIEGGSAGRKISFTNQKVCFGNKLCCFAPLGINYRFLFYYLQCPLFLGLFKEQTSGIIGGVGLNTLKRMYLPIPPLAEQQRIARRLDSLFNNIDALRQQ